MMMKNSKIYIRAGSDVVEEIKKSAEEQDITFSEMCRRKLEKNHKLQKMETLLTEIDRNLKYLIKYQQEVNMVTKLPEFKGYTVDKRLKQFIKIDHGKPSIDFVDFDSEER